MQGINAALDDGVERENVDKVLLVLEILTPALVALKALDAHEVNAAEDEHNDEQSIDAFTAFIMSIGADIYGPVGVDHEHAYIWNTHHKGDDVLDLLPLLGDQNLHRLPPKHLQLFAFQFLKCLEECAARFVELVQMWDIEVLDEDRALKLCLREHVFF